MLAGIVFALGVLSDRIYYDIGAANRHNFRFATAVGFMAVLTLPLAFRRRIPPVTLGGAHRGRPRLRCLTSSPVT